MTSRQAVRVLLFDAADRLLLVRFRDGDRSWWLHARWRHRARRDRRGGMLEPLLSSSAAAWCWTNDATAWWRFRRHGSARARPLDRRWKRAGKSTIARELAAEHGFRVYTADATIGDHAHRSNSIEHSFIHAFQAMDMDERWANRPPSAMLDTFHALQAGVGAEREEADLAGGMTEAGEKHRGFRELLDAMGDDVHQVSPSAA